MLRFVTERLSEEELRQAAEDMGGYIKVVADVERNVITAGGSRHVDGEQLLLEQGSRQEHLWGGGLDLTTGAIDYDSMINLRPNQGNPSREILSAEMRARIDAIIRKLLR